MLWYSELEINKKLKLFIFCMGSLSKKLINSDTVYLKNVKNKPRNLYAIYDKNQVLGD